VVHAYNPNIQEVEAEVEDCRFKASLRYTVRPSLKKAKEITMKEKQSMDHHKF
jgi:hypothetical protein